MGPGARARHQHARVERRIDSDFAPPPDTISHADARAVRSNEERILATCCHLVRARHKSAARDKAHPTETCKREGMARSLVLLLKSIAAPIACTLGRKRSCCRAGRDGAQDSVDAPFGVSAAGFAGSLDGSAEAEEAAVALAATLPARRKRTVRLRPLTPAAAKPPDDAETKSPL